VFFDLDVQVSVFQIIELGAEIGIDCDGYMLFPVYAKSQIAQST